MSNSTSIFSNRLLRRTLKDEIWQHKWSWLLWVGVGPILPFLEMIMIGCVLLIISKEHMESGVSFLAELAWIPDWTSKLVSDYTPHVVLSVALAVLLFHVGARYFVEVQGQILRYGLETRTAMRLTSYYLNTPPLLAFKIGKNRVVHSMLQDSGSLGMSIKLVVDMAVAIWSIVIYLTGALYAAWEVVAVTGVIYLIPLWISRHVYQKMKGIGKKKIAAGEHSLGFFNDIFQGFNRSKLDGLEESLLKRSSGVIENNFIWRVDKRRLQAKFKSLMDGMSMFGLVAILFVGVVVLKTDLALLMVLFVVFNRMKAAVEVLSTNALSIKEMAPSLERHFGLLDEFSKIPMWREGGKKLPEVELRSLQLKNVGFSYDESKGGVLKNINMEAKPGDRILITGPSGQGKSTLLEVIAGILPPSSGHVYYDGHVLDDRIFYAARNQIAYSSPTVYLFRDTLRNNLLAGVSSTNVSLDIAIHHAGLDEVIASLPEGLDTEIGADGEKLSLGQRQRVILARTFLKNPKLVLLDEATSNLDPSLEGDIINRLQSFLDKDCILLMISHKVPEDFRYTRHFSLRNGRLSEYVDASKVAEYSD